MNEEYNKYSNEEIIKKLDSNIEGLSSKEVSNRLKNNGKNILPKAKKTSIYKIFGSQFTNAITIIMLITCTFSFCVNEIIDGIAILFIIMVDVIMGTIQEVKAQKSVEALTNIIKVKTKVIRNGSEILIDSENLVVGDIILLESGDKISADARILDCSNLTVNESALTGESMACIKLNKVSKKETNKNINMLYAGTNVITGRCKAIVIKTGVNTDIGLITSKVIESKEELSPLTIRMNKFTRQISVLIVIITIILTVLLLFRGFEIKEMFLSVVALAVSAMPEGLPLALTLALTIGANRMAKKNVVVKKLNSVESLGSCTVIASDKTGTLTVNEQTLKKILFPNGDFCEVSGSGYNDVGEVSGTNIEQAKNIAKYGYLNNEAGLYKEKDNKWNYYGDSIDIAFLAYAKKCNINVEDIKRIGSIPYESENKYSVEFYIENDKVMCTMKGSYEVILKHCNKMMYNNKIKVIDKDLIMEQNKQLASEGYRVIAIAKSEVKNFKEKDIYTDKDIPNLIFMGLAGFIDPVRKEVKKSIKSCVNSGIKVVMITGDHPLTAFSIANKLELADSFNYVATGDDIEINYAKGMDNFDSFVKSKTVFARVTPIQKLEIIESYKRQKEFVAVTGDGVNDAPALKAANIGIAMGSGTDVAKETSSMIIVDDNFMSIANAVNEGRNAYNNIRKVVYMLLSCGLAEVLFFSLSVLFNLPMPLVAIQLLWLNIVTDGIQDLALSFEKESLDDTKVRTNGNIFDKLLTQETLLAGISIGLTVFVVYYMLIKVFNMELETARGYIMALMVFMQNIHVLNCRSERKSIFKNPLKNNILVVYSIFGSILLQVIVMEVGFLSKFLQTNPIPFNHLILLFLASLPILFIMETFKEIKR